MRIKRSFIFLTFLLSLTICDAQLKAYAFNDVVDCIVAVVNNRVITLTDLKFMDSFSLYEEEIGNTGGDRLASILEKAIDQKVILDLIPGNLAVTGEELAQSLSGLAQKLGAEDIRNKLGQFGAGEETLRSFIEEKLLYQKVISQRFSQTAVVSLKEIETYYQETYLPGQKKQGLEPEPMVQILGQIESLIKKEKTAQQISTWTKNLRAQAEIRVKWDCLKQDQKREERR